MTGIMDDGSAGTSAGADEAGSADPAGCAKREQILKGAGTVFLANGYEGASMSRIAQMAGVSKGTLYNHFDGKASLFSAFFEEQARCRLAPIVALSRSDGQSVRLTLVRFADMTIHLLISPMALGLYRIIIGEVEKFPNLADTFWRYGFDRTLGNLTEFLTRSVARGELDIADPALSAEQFLLMCQTRIVQRRRFRLPVDDSDAAIAELAGFIADSFLKIYEPRHQ
ncbi:TetR/AcrR family transcriptional regulator [Gluconobacter oxydans]|uniref:TetR family transcriptional regulator n=3 Tax=Gluconobacter oxydans TaxID=442 RepID=A0A149RV78_GLUOY|nr:TetR/AcrR family transcriptional regulator [Gluconobacter oxydans]AHK70777.1 TetR family transcriptional regulator [Gluconobacter oxydans DSM 3504]KXV08590.1 TetR family transcriptional regulator [Gluconobacter oxydans]KXV11569.1 TetR family transcriptional regulator [Gluconobacter oxydans]KXV18377.1 TetR family transcriptional regulator [Gluconobacter oxydans]MCP1248177.1 TetR/AcrR family transcriptional regulator [Gluconobacter oxydans]